MNAKLIYTFAILLLSLESISAAKVFRTENFSPKIKTLRVQVLDNWLSPPVIQLEGGEQIEISFDELDAQPTRYVYSLIHCNADWTQSQLVQSEYMSGFQNLLVENYEHSFNTTMDFVNYKINIPNQDLTMKVSGNYAVILYKEEDLTTPVFCSCFSVVEPETGISMKVSSDTDIDFNKSHQQLNFEVEYGSEIKSPLQELKVYVMQNNRRDNMAKLIQPINVQAKKLLYNHNKNLIFEAGNEYRRFEMISSSQYKGINVEALNFFSPYFHVELYQDKIRANKSYTYDEDINGRFFIRTIDGVDYDFESDYFFVHFSFPCEDPFLKNIYMLSDIFHKILDERSLMKYNSDTKAYEMTQLLKQGAYNYMYVTKKSQTSEVGSPALIEGNYFQTENEYTVMVYHRPFGGKYDKLIGTQTIQYK